MTLTPAQGPTPSGPWPRAALGGVAVSHSMPAVSLQSLPGQAGPSPAWGHPLYRVQRHPILAPSSLGWAEALSSTCAGC